ncbi:MAG: hypothetical protein CM15mP46_1800 [Alphaproteobacteria bacterium]|nr:MAG: hypothetical protein CM15mP46_1800 [Alphaproteobacteria bacterium]
MTVSFEALRDADQQTVRGAVRSGAYQDHTAGLATGYLQANLVIVEDIYALDFMRYCQRNPKPARGWRERYRQSHDDYIGSRH